MDRISEVARCRKSAGSFGAHSTTTAPHKSTPALVPRAAQSGPLDARPARLVHSRARTAASASEPTEQDYSSGLAGPRDAQPFENNFQGWVQEVCWMSLILPPLQHQLLAEAFDLLLLQPARLLQSCLRPLLVLAPCVPRPFRVLPLSLVLLCQRAKIPPAIFSRAPFSRWITRFQYGPCSSC